MDLGKNDARSISLKETGRSAAAISFLYTVSVAVSLFNITVQRRFMRVSFTLEDIVNLRA